MSTDDAGSEDLQEMSRAELVEQVRMLKDRVDRLGTNKVDRTAVNNLIAALTDSHDEIGDYTADPMEHRDLLEARQERMDRHGRTISQVNERLESLGDLKNTASTNSEKVEAIKQAARNSAEAGDDKATLSAQEIKNATGVSRRYAYTLMDEDDGLPADYEWASHQPEKYKRRGTPDRGNVRQKKTQNQALVVDLDQLPGGPA